MQVCKCVSHCKVPYYVEGFEITSQPHYNIGCIAILSCVLTGRQSSSLLSNPLIQGTKIRDVFSLLGKLFYLCQNCGQWSQCIVHSSLYFIHLLFSDNVIIIIVIIIIIIVIVILYLSQSRNVTKKELFCKICSPLWAKRKCDPKNLAKPEAWDLRVIPYTCILVSDVQHASLLYVWCFGLSHLRSQSQRSVQII